MGQGLVFFNYYTLDVMRSKKLISDKAYISKKESIDIFLKSCLFPRLESHKSNIIGWPLIEGIGGKTFDDIRSSEEKYFISNLDRHPNAEGQILFAKLFIDKYKEIYK